MIDIPRDARIRRDVLVQIMVESARARVSQTLTKLNEQNAEPYAR